MVTCHIALGSNLGDREYEINSAIKRIRMLSLTRVLKISSFLKSLPQGGPSQGPYLNAVIEIETELNPYLLLQELQKIEHSQGRIRTVVNGPRTIDLDILLYGDIFMNEAALSIPHPRILEREFVLVSLREIAPDVIKKIKNKLKARAKVKVTKAKTRGKKGKKK